MVSPRVVGGFSVKSQALMFSGSRAWGVSCFVGEAVPELSKGPYESKHPNQRCLPKVIVAVAAFVSFKPLGSLAARAIAATTAAEELRRVWVSITTRMSSVGSINPHAEA